MGWHTNRKSPDNLSAHCNRKYTGPKVKLKIKTQRENVEIELNMNKNACCVAVHTGERFVKEIRSTYKCLDHCDSLQTQLTDCVEDVDDIVGP